MSPRKDVSEKRKNQILKAAQKIFSEVGFHKARMADIAESSGLSKGSLYWYFENKNAIIIHLLERIFEPELREFRKLVDDERPALERLEIYLDRVIQDMEKMIHWMPLAYDFISLAFRQKAVQQTITNYYQQNMAILIPIIQQGMDSGEIQAASAEEAAIAIGAIIEGTAVLWVYDSESIDVSRHIRSSMEILLEGLKAES